ncbi:MAG: 16S rRNA (cytosine(1402)-N(4))-methyltransferase RsmH [Patescibacteria group bacterium]
MAVYSHQSVLVKELIQFLRPKPGQHYVDCTLGGGGHTEAILQLTSPKGKVLAFELDERAIAAAKKRLNKYSHRLEIIRDSYAHLQTTIEKRRPQWPKISGVILDLGLSSDQLEQAQRGFSFQEDSPLDMRFDTRQTLTASDIVLTWPEEKIRAILREYGEEVQAKRLAKGIVLWRDNLISARGSSSSGQKQKQKIVRTSMLVSTILAILNIKTADLKKYRRHPATKVFQALRIAVNQELENLQAILPQAIDILAPGGQLAVISFHSLEDRIVKKFFQGQTKKCVCPPDSPICVCGAKARLQIMTKKPIRPSWVEIASNPRSRSALLRVAKKL